MTALGKMYSPLFALVAISLTIGACAPRPKSTWRQPGVTGDQWNSDKINCRSLARRKIDREMRAEASQAGPDAYRNPTTLGQSMKRYEAKKRERALFEACVRSRGFKKTTPQDTNKDAKAPGKL